MAEMGCFAAGRPQQTMVYPTEERLFICILARGRADRLAVTATQLQHFFLRFVFAK
jgi:hypothetical protein